METRKVNVAGPCRCGGQVKIFGPSDFAPHSHWGLYCSHDNCEHMVTGQTLEAAILEWNHSLEPVHR